MFSSGGCDREDASQSKREMAAVEHRQGLPFMKLHLLDHLRNALSVQSRVVNMYRERAGWRLTVKSVSNSPAEALKKRNRPEGLQQWPFTVPFAWIIEACLSKNTSQFSHGTCELHRQDERGWWVLHCWYVPFGSSGFITRIKSSVERGTFKSSCLSALT